MATDGLVGERIVTRYVKHPATGTLALTNGQPMAARDAMIVDSNISHLAEESCRHLVWSIGPGVVTKFGSTAAAFSGIRDIPDASTELPTSALQLIPWDRRTAARFGPFLGVGDQNDGNGNATLRPVRMMTDYTIGAAASTTKWFMAMTSSPSAAALFDGSSVLASATQDTGGSSGSSRVILKMTPTVPITPSSPPLQRLPCRASGSNGQVLSLVYPFWLWFGWLIVCANNCYINGLSAWELRAGG